MLVPLLPPAKCPQNAHWGTISSIWGRFLTWFFTVALNHASNQRLKSSVSATPWAKMAKGYLLHSRCCTPQVRWRRRHSFQHVDDGELANQFPVPRQLEPKPNNNLLSHEVVSNIPTDSAVKRFGHDVARSQGHALRYLPLERCRRLPPPFHQGGYRRSAGWFGAGVRRSASIARGYGGYTSTRYRRGIDAT